MHRILSIVFASLVAQAAAADMPRIMPEGPFWDTAPGFDFPETDNPRKFRRALSGIACPRELNEPRRCVAVFDEGVEARYVIIDGARLIPQAEPIVLLTGKHELDAEGAAHDGRFVYVTGSHSRKREHCVANPHSRHVYRLPLQPDGRLQPSAPVDDKGRLWRAMSNDSVLGTFVDNCLGKEGHGINIEGVAARDDKLYFGFREPAQDKTAYILRVGADALFEGENLAPKLFTLTGIGKASGVRDLLAVPEGFLVLVGPDDDSKDDVPWWIGFWDGDDSRSDVQLRELAELKLPKPGGDDCQREVKPEAITLLSDGPEFRRVLVLSDGICDGGPLVFRIRK